ncbi:MAG: right-handed parallel beta-helix repeat-containing protein [Thermoplasmatota archaeon]
MSRIRSITLAVAFFLLAVMASTTTVTANDAPHGTETRGPLVAHAPIHIYQNLSQKASQEGWAGSGIDGDPYIIEDLDIDATGSNYGFFISNTEEHFIIRNCRVHDADTETSSQYRGNGIYLIQVSNGSLEDCEIFRSNYHNIMVNMCDNLTLSGNEVYGSANSVGLMTWRSQDIRIESNSIFDNPAGGFDVSGCERVITDGTTIEDNDGNGVSIVNIYGSTFIDNTIANNTLNAFSVTGSCPDNQFSGNVMVGGSIVFSMDAGTLTRHTITTNNTVDGDPVYYYKNSDMTGSSVPSDAGEVILANVKGLYVSSIVFDTGTAAVIAGYCEAITIDDCIMNGQLQGITVFETSNSTIEGNELTGIVYNAISIQGGQGNIIKENGISDAMNAVIVSGATFGNLVSGNTITSCDTGVTLYMSYLDTNPGTDNTVEFNRIEGCSNKGVYAQMEERSIISNNTIIDSWIGIELFNTKNMTVSGNLVLGNDIGISVNGRYWGSSWHNLVAGNRIENTNGTGIEVNRSMGGAYTGNLLYKSKSYGVRIENSHSNVINVNTFLWNNGSTDSYSPTRIQAKDDSTDNDWDREGSGNHWTDWTGPDADGDGIVDEPYLIFGDENFDNRPLTRSPVVVISEPLDLVAIPGDGSVELSWSPPKVNFDSVVRQYIVHRRQGDDPTFMPIIVEGMDTTLVDDEVENNIEYHYSVAGQNKYGTGTFSEEVMVTPDGTPPMVEITFPEEGYITNDRNLTFSWMGADDVSFDHFEVKLDEGNWTDVGENRSMESGPLEEGQHTFHLVGIDKVGNRNETNVSFIIDLTPPEGEFLTEPDELVLNEVALTIEWTGSDDVALKGYEIRSDQGDWMDLNTSTSYLLENLTEGGHVVEVRIWDLGGNFHVISTTVTVDLTSPDVRIIWPVDGLDTIEKDIVIEWFTVDFGPGEVNHLVRIDEDEWIDVGENVEYEVSGLSLGNHTITVRATDLAGNQDEDTVSFEVFDKEVPPPKVSISGRVVDRKGNPISGVKISSDDGAETSSDSDGDFVILVEKGPRILKFTKKGYRSWEESINADDNMTIPSGDIVLEEKEDDDTLLGLRRACYICIGAPMAILLVLILIGIMARISRGRRRQEDYEE